MGRPRHTSYFKPQAKTANIRRVAPDGIAHYQYHGQQRSNHPQKVDAWGAKIAAEEQYHGVSSPMYNLPASPPSEALMNSATEFLNGVLSDLCAMDAPMLTSSVSVDFMNCDPVPEELMNVDDDLTLDYMDVDVAVPDIEGSLATFLMDVDDFIYSPIMIDSVLPSPVAPDFSALTDFPVAPPPVRPTTPKCNLSAELSVVRRELASFVRQELASTNEALQRISELVSRSPVEQAMGVSPQIVPDVVQSANEFLLPPADITSAHDNPAQCGMFIDFGVAFVSEGIRILDLSDKQVPVLETFSEGPIPPVATVPGSQAELVSPSSNPSSSSQELDTFDTADLLGLYSDGPLHSTPVNGDSGKTLEALDVWADIASLQDLYVDLPIRDLPDDPLTTFPWDLAEEVVHAFDHPPPVERQSRPTEVVDSLPHPEATINETIQNVHSEINAEKTNARMPCEPSIGDVVRVLEKAPCEVKVGEDGKLEGRISSESIIQIMKDRAEMDAKKKARKARAQLKRRLAASPRLTAEPGSPSAILPSRSENSTSVAQAISASTPALESPLPKTAVTNDPKVEAPPTPDTSNIAASNRSPRRIVLKSRLASPNNSIRSEPPKANPPILPLDIGKESVPPVTLKTRSSPSTIQAITKNILEAKSTALSSPSLSTINQNVQHVSKISSPLSSSSSPINKECTPAKVPKAASSGNVSVTTSSPSLSPLIAPVKSVDHALEPRIVYLPHTHAMMRERNMRLTPPSTSTLCPARNSEFFTPRTKYVPKRSGSYLRLYSFQSKTSPDDVARSRPETSNETPAAILVDATEAQPVVSRERVLHSPVGRTPDFIVTKAAKVKVLPGAVPTTDYHEDIELPVCRPDYQPTWLQRLRLHMFGW